MFNLSRLWKKKEDDAQPPSTQKEKVFHISQPVLAFVSTYLETPSRFEIQDYWQGCIYAIYDKHTKEKFSVRCRQADRLMKSIKLK